MPYLVVCPVTQVDSVGAKYAPSHMLTVMSEKSDVPRPASVKPQNHKTLIFNDISAERDGLVVPASNHVKTIFEFAKQWDRQAPLMIHCFAGVSRSTASAYIIANAMGDKRCPIDLAKELRLRSPTATPNARMIALADVLLDKNGELVSAIRDIGRGAYCYEGAPFVFPLREADAHIF